MKKQKFKRTKFITKTFAFIWTISTIITAGIGNFFYNYALNPKSKRNIFNNGKQKEDTEKKDYAKKEKEHLWLKKNTQDIYLLNKEHLKLHGYCSALSTNNYIIICHGYMGDATHMIDYAKHFYEEGFNIILPDARAHGLSEGNYIGMGWPERLDILEWIHYIMEKNANAQIILFGVSMGAATVMMTSGEKLPSSVKLVIEDCGYTSVWEQFTKELKESFGLPAFPIMNISSLVTKIRAGYSLKEASAIKQIKKCTIPILFIHGDKDTFVPFSMHEKLYNTANEKKEKLVVHGAEHGKSVYINPTLYWNKIDTFIKEYLY